MVVITRTCEVSDVLFTGEIAEAYKVEKHPLGWEVVLLGNGARSNYVQGLCAGRFTALSCLCWGTPLCTRLLLFKVDY